MDNEYVWTSSGTNIEIRWAKFYGWVRPSETPETKKKWADHKAMMSRLLEELDDLPR